MNLRRIFTALACSALLLVPFTSVSAQEIDIHQQTIPSKQPFIGDPLPKVSQKETSSLGNFSLSDIENSNSLFHALAPTRTVTILIAADEEYRAHPDWKTITAQVVEKADNSFWAEHSINFVVTGYANWKSDGANSSALLADLNTEWKNNTQYDFVIGFTKDSKFTAGGIAYVYSSAPQSGISVVLDRGTTSTPTQSNMNGLTITDYRMMLLVAVSNA